MDYKFKRTRLDKIAEANKLKFGKRVMKMKIFIFCLLMLFSSQVVPAQTLHELCEPVKSDTKIVEQVTAYAKHHHHGKPVVADMCSYKTHPEEIDSTLKWPLPL